MMTADNDNETKNYVTFASQHPSQNVAQKLMVTKPKLNIFKK